MSKLKGGFRPQQGSARGYSERKFSELASESLSDSHVDAQYSLRFVSRDETEDGFGGLSGSQPLGVRNRESDNEEITVESFTPSTSATSNAPLRPNRLGPNGHIELGRVQDPSMAGGWVSNWTSQFKSPLGESLGNHVWSSFVLTVLRCYATMWLLTYLFILMSLLFASARGLK